MQSIPPFSCVFLFFPPTLHPIDSLPSHLALSFLSRLYRVAMVSRTTSVRPCSNPPLHPDLTLSFLFFTTGAKISVGDKVRVTKVNKEHTIFAWPGMGTPL